MHQRKAIIQLSIYWKYTKVCYSYCWFVGVSLGHDTVLCFPSLTKMTLRIHCCIIYPSIATHLDCWSWASHLALYSEPDRKVRFRCSYLSSFQVHVANDRNFKSISFHPYALLPIRKPSILCSCIKINFGKGPARSQMLVSIFPLFCPFWLVGSLTVYNFLIVQLVKNPPAMQETPVRFLGLEDPLEKWGYPLQYSWASLGAQLVKNPPAMWETWVWSLGWEDPLEKGKATHSSILVWRILWAV